MRQRRLGSLPSSSTASCDASSSRAWWNVFSGQSIRRTLPSTSETCGRVELKSKKRSGSMSANFSALPRLGEERAGHRRAVAAVVPAAERRDRTGRRSSGSALDAKLVVRIPHRAILLRSRGRQSDATNATVAAQRAIASVTWMSTIHHEHVDPVLELADQHLHDEHGEHRKRDQRRWRLRRRASQTTSTANEIPKTAVARTCSHIAG